MIRLILILAAALALAGCATSPRTSTIEDGKVTNITSAEAVTLVKQDVRRQKVADVQTNQKPIVKLTAHAGRPIQIDAAAFEVYVPIDPAILLAEQPDSVSENVQMAREVVNGVKAAAPIIGAGLVFADRKDARASAERITEMESAAAVEMETLRSAERQSLSRDPIVLTIPEGGTAGILKTD